METFYKLGVSKDPDKRFKFGAQKVIDSDLSLEVKVKKLLKGDTHISDHPYQFEKIHTVEFKFDGEALSREQELLTTVTSNRHIPKKPFSGLTECFKCNDEALELLVELMNDMQKEAKDDEPEELMYKLFEVQVKEFDPIKRHRLVIEKIKSRG
ncbi:MAG: hypothetical protein NVV72_10535 [Asticcacaulis sp.]|nr:hypothetical protein [Asticcacaulis sp.]